ncbi:MAG: hypothetical protein HYV09_34070 [Deltaproteobacteria bacterium]|nr:hypothetical protein [Deltaproteobacteria bacterium]
MTSRGLLVVCALVVGCGGKTAETIADTGATGDGATGADAPDAAIDTRLDGAAFDYCKASADRAAKCGTGAVDPAECAAQLSCYRTIVRSSELDPLLVCFATRECTKKDDQCVADAASKYLSDPAVQAYVKACNEKRTACGGGFSDDYCGYDHGLLTDDARAKLKACVERSCAEVSDCFDVVFTAAGCR